MAQKKQNIIINVRTLPNGYSLDIEVDGRKNGFMYFNPYKLLDGFMYHVGLMELDEITDEFRAEVLKAAIAWQDNGELVKLNLKYEAKIAELKSKVSSLQKQLAKKKAKEEEAESDTPKRMRGKGKPRETVKKQRNTSVL